MKITCGVCSAKYAIADEKLVGRSVKIRCKKCGEAIVVRGEVQAAVEPRAAVAAGDWHVVVDGEQRGPLLPSAIGALLSSGAIAWDAYVWREGLAEWTPAEELPELVQAIMGEPAPAPRSTGADLFATESQSAFSAGSHHDDAVVASPHASARTARADAMTGARNESSVLFSLANLSALGAGARTGTPHQASGAPRAMATGDGSGLIDIRALASATGLGSSESQGPRAASRVDDLLGVGGPSLSLGAALAPPVLIAERSEAAGGARTLIFAAAILAVGLLGGASALAYVSVGRDPARSPSAGIEAPILLAPPIATPEIATPVVVVHEEVTVPREQSTPPIALRPTTHRVPQATHVAVVSTETDTETPDETPHARGLDEMMERALRTPREPAVEHTEAVAPPAPAAGPSRPDVMSAMSRVQPAVSACGAGEHGVATVQVTIAASGHVSNAVVSTAFIAMRPADADGR